MDNNDYTDLLQKVEQLEEENKELRKWQVEVNGLMGRLIELIEDERNQIASLNTFSKINRYRIDSLPYEMAAPNYKVDVVYPDMMTIDETRKALIYEGKSIARLGDGEFSAIVGMKRWNFQGVDAALGERMQEVLGANNPNLMIGLNPNFYKALFDMDESDADGVRAYMRPMVRRLHSQFLKKDRKYADAVFHTMNTRDDVNTLKEIWGKRDCVFIEGRYTRMGVGNDLFDNAKSVTRILAPSENAFDRYSDILRVACEQPKDKLFLIALGPTATVLAYDLCNAGYQAIDIGHMDLLYEQFSQNLSSLYQVKIPYKYCNSDEQGEKREIEEINDPVYESQIIARIY